MKRINLSLPAEDVAFLDRYAARTVTSRSAAVREAIDRLREAELAVAYTAAFAEWDAGPDSAFRDRFSGDGIDDEPR
ncbi:ribbon-helix-helix protein, CopG family [Streptomyces sp. NPDC046887]|uniref:ribbon-helix-helix protein, CopG family n=1 Tax=Streptomyces sp. NPDC046887 TaxID=3155472 RepID=UPI00340E021E